MERSKFPILLAVAQKCRAERYGTVQNFVTTVTSQLVSELAEKHRTGVRPANAAVLPEKLNFLTSIDWWRDLCRTGR